MLIKLLLIMGTWAVFGRCKIGTYETSVPKELNNLEDN